MHEQLGNNLHLLFVIKQKEKKMNVVVVRIRLMENGEIVLLECFLRKEFRSVILVFLIERAEGEKFNLYTILNDVVRYLVCKQRRDM